MVPSWLANVPLLTLGGGCDGQYGRCCGSARLAAGAAPRQAPLSGRRCIGFHLSLQLLDVGGWIVAAEMTSMAAFRIAADDGEARVMNEPSQSYLRTSTDTVLHPSRARRDVLDVLLRQAGQQDGRWFSWYPLRYRDAAARTWRVRCVEGLLVEGERAAVCGAFRREVSRNASGASGYRGIKDELCVAASHNAPLVVVSGAAQLAQVGA